MTLKIPGGMPARSASSAKARAERGVSSAGLIITGQPAARAGEDDNLFIMYTSGTTGNPKGVVHTHKTVFWALLTLANTAEDARFATRLRRQLQATYFRPRFEAGEPVETVTSERQYRVYD